MSSTFKEGDIVKYNSNITHKRWVGTPMIVRLTNNKKVIYTVLVHFVRNIPEMGVTADHPYWINPKCLEPATQQELDNWILEQELTS